jgi:DNA-binding NarL/FixJ family response regulator
MTKELIKTTNQIRLAIVEDHPVVLSGLATHLKREAGIKVVIEAQDGLELLNSLHLNEVDIVLLDLEMPRMNGIQTLNQLCRNHSRIGVIIFSIHQDDETVFELLKLGAKGFLNKSSSFDEIIDAIFNVQYKGFHSSEIIAKAINKLGTYKHKEVIVFEGRETKILELICDGLLSSEIALRIPCSKKLVDLIRSRIMKKMGVSTIASLVRKSIYLGYYIPKSDDQIFMENQMEENQREIRRQNRLRKKE